jgi:hypothetical protein
MARTIAPQAKGENQDASIRSFAVTTAMRAAPFRPE